MKATEIKQVASISALSVVLIAFKVGMHILMRDVSTPIQPQPQTPPVEVTITAKRNHGLASLQAIQNGMTFDEVKRTLGIIGLTNNVDQYLNQPDVLVKWANPDGSTLEVTFHEGKVVSKGRSLPVNRISSHPKLHQRVFEGFPKEDYRDARSHFHTQLVKQSKAPQFGEPLHAPKGALQITYSTKPRLQAWVSPAPQGEKHKPHPAVLFLHGGFAVGGGDWEMTQPYRDAGYIVMMPALRGENGQGGDYSMFYNEVSDVLAASDALAKLPYVDSKHIYLAGHSVGGTLVQLSAETSSRFRAAASFSGSPDQYIWTEDQPEVIPFDAKNDEEFNMRSPIAFATSFKCPARLYFGDQESWCDYPTQRLIGFAKEGKVDVQLVRIPGDHFSEVPEAMKQSIAFFRSQR